MRTLVHLIRPAFRPGRRSLAGAAARTGRAPRAGRGGGVGRPDPARQERAIRGRARLPRHLAGAADHRAGQPRYFAVQRVPPLPAAARTLQALHHRRPRSDPCRRRDRGAGDQYRALADVQGRPRQRGAGGQDPRGAGRARSGHHPHRRHPPSVRPAADRRRRRPGRPRADGDGGVCRMRRRPAAGGAPACQPRRQHRRALPDQRVRGAGDPGRHRHLDPRARRGQFLQCDPGRARRGSKSTATAGTC